MPDTHDAGRLFTHSAQLDPDAPVFHWALTAEYDDPCRYSRSVVIKTPLRRRGRWHGIRKSWLSVQIKLPTGIPVPGMRWGIVLGWWRFPKANEEWTALAKATRLDHDLDELDECNFEDPTGASTRRALSDVDRRRVPSDDDAGADA